MVIVWVFKITLQEAVMIWVIVEVLKLVVDEVKYG